MVEKLGDFRKWAVLGSVYEMQQDYDEAITCYSVGASYFPNEPDYYIKRANVYRTAHKFTEAIEDYSKFLELSHGFNEDAYFYRGLCYFMLDRWDNCLTDCTKAISLRADYIPAYSLRGNCYYQIDMPEKALIDFNTAIRLDPDRINTHYDRGKLFAYYHRYKEAIDDLDIVVSKCPNCVSGYLYRFLCRSSLGWHKEATDDLNHALQLNQDETIDFLRNHGWECAD